MGKILGWGVIGLVVLAVLSAISGYNTLVNQESGIIGADKARQTTMSNIGQKVNEVINVKDMNVEDIRKTVNEQIKARSGDGGMQNVVLMLKENNIAPSQEVVLKIVNIIDIGREEIRNQEIMLNDRKSVSCSYRNQFPRNVLLSITGGGRLQIGCFGGPDDYAPLLSASAAESYRTGVDKGLINK